nr:hypothetical protein Itr_chr07CG08230 [Ipomoea trifida]GLL31350.1 hypothetical protein Itr_chr07CG08240 [Ipomoea trifida]
MPSATSNTAARNSSHQRGKRARHPPPPRLQKLALALVARPSSLLGVVDHEVRRGRKQRPKLLLVIGETCCRLSQATTGSGTTIARRRCAVSHLHQHPPP